jgi:hypothetical protein
MKLTTKSHIAPALGMIGPIPLLTPLCLNVTNRHNFTVLTYTNEMCGPR